MPKVIPASFHLIVHYCHKHNGLRQHDFILLQFWKSEASRGFPGLEALDVPPEALEAPGRVYSLPTPGSRDHLYYLSYGSFLHLQSQERRISFLFSHRCFRLLQ